MIKAQFFDVKTYCVEKLHSFERKNWWQPESNLRLQGRCLSLNHSLFSDSYVETGFFFLDQIIDVRINLQNQKKTKIAEIFRSRYQSRFRFYLDFRFFGFSVTTPGFFGFDKISIFFLSMTFCLGAKDQGGA